jgi:hypothetical protein
MSTLQRESYITKHIQNKHFIPNFILTLQEFFVNVSDIVVSQLASLGFVNLTFDRSHLSICNFPVPPQYGGSVELYSRQLLLLTVFIFNYFI